jgi:hypothetical protein
MQGSELSSSITVTELFWAIAPEQIRRMNAAGRILKKLKFLTGSKIKKRAG